MDRAWESYEGFYQENREQFFESPLPEDPWPERYLNTHNCVPGIKEILEYRKLLHITDLIFGRKTRPFHRPSQLTKVLSSRPTPTRST